MKTYLAILFTMIFYLGCDVNTKECNFEYVDNGRVTYRVKGCLVDSLEQGLWTVYDSTKTVVEEGEYNNGIRIGMWHYPLQSFPNNSIEWVNYHSQSLGFSTNIPVILNNPEEGQYYVRWKHPDSTKSLRLIIGFHDVPTGQINLDSFYRQGLAELGANQFSVTHSLDKIVASGKTYYFNFYQVSGSQNKFQILNCYSYQNNRLVDLSVRFEKADEIFARNIYTSVLSNIFIDSSRFLYPFATIKKS